MEFDHKKDTGENHLSPKDDDLRFDNAIPEDAAPSATPSLRAIDARPGKEELNWSNRLSRRSILSVEEEIYIPADAPLLETQNSAEDGEPAINATADNGGDITIAMGGLPSGPRQFDDLTPTEEPEPIPEASFWDETVRPLLSDDESGRQPAILASAPDTGELGSPPWNEAEGYVKAEHLLKAQTIPLNQDELAAGTNVPIDDGLELSAEISHIFADDEPEGLNLSAPDMELTDNDLLDAAEPNATDNEVFMLESRIKELTAEDGGAPELNSPPTASAMDFDKLVRARELHTAQKLEALITPATPPAAVKIIADMSKSSRATFPPVKSVTPVTDAQAALSANDDLNDLTGFLETRASDVISAPSAPAKTLNHTDKNNTMGDAELKKFLSNKASHAETTDDTMDIQRDAKINLDDEINLDDDFLLNDGFEASASKTAEPVAEAFSPENEERLFRAAEMDTRGIENVIMDDLPEIMEIESYFASPSLKQDLKINPATFIQDLSEIDVLGLDNLSPDDNAFTDVEPLENFSLADPDDIMDLVSEPDGPAFDVAAMDALMHDIGGDTSKNLSAEDLAGDAGLKAAEDAFIRLQQANLEDEGAVFDLGPTDDDLESIETVIDIAQLEMGAVAVDDEDMGVPDVTPDDDLPDTEALFAADILAEDRDSANGMLATFSGENTGFNDNQNLAETPSIIIPAAETSAPPADNNLSASVSAVKTPVDNIFATAAPILEDEAKDDVLVTDIIMDADEVLEVLEPIVDDADDDILIMDETPAADEPLEALEPIIDDTDDDVLIMDITPETDEAPAALEPAVDDAQDEVLELEITPEADEAPAALEPTVDDAQDEIFGLEITPEADEALATMEPTVDNAQDEIFGLEITPEADEGMAWTETAPANAAATDMADSHADFAKMLKNITPYTMTKLFYDEAILAESQDEMDFEPGAFYSDTETRDESLAYEFTTNVFGVNLPPGLAPTPAEDQNKTYVHPEAGTVEATTDDQPLPSNDILPSSGSQAEAAIETAETTKMSLAVDDEYANLLFDAADNLLTLETALPAATPVTITDEIADEAAPEAVTENDAAASLTTPLEIDREYFKFPFEPTEDFLTLATVAAPTLNPTESDTAPEIETAARVAATSANQPITDSEYFQALITPADDLLSLKTTMAAPLTPLADMEMPVTGPEVTAEKDAPAALVTPLTTDGAVPYTLAPEAAVLTPGDAEQAAASDDTFETAPEMPFLDLSKPEEAFIATETTTQTESDEAAGEGVLSAQEAGLDAAPDEDVLSTQEAWPDAAPDEDVLSTQEAGPDAAPDEDVLSTQEAGPDAAPDEDVFSTQEAGPDAAPEETLPLEPAPTDGITDKKLPSAAPEILTERVDAPQDSVETPPAMQETAPEPDLQTDGHTEETPAADNDFILCGNFTLEQDAGVSSASQTAQIPTAPAPQVSGNIAAEADLDAEFEIASDPMRELAHSIPSAETPYDFKAAEQRLQAGYEEYVMEHDPLTELEISVAQFENPAAFKLAEPEPVNGAMASDDADITGETAADAGSTIMPLPGLAQTDSVLEPLDNTGVNALAEKQKTPAAPLELDQPELDTNFRFEDLGVDLIDFYRDKVIAQTEDDYREYIKSPGTLSDYQGLAQDMDAAQLHNAYEDFLDSPPEPQTQTPPDATMHDLADNETTAPDAMSAEPLSPGTAALEDEIITLKEPALSENLTTDPVLAYNDLVQSTPTAPGTDPETSKNGDFIKDNLTDHDRFAMSPAASRPAATPMDDDDEEMLSLTEIAAATQPESQRVQIAEPDANLQQLVEDITTERVTSNVLKHMPQTLLANEQFSSDLRPMINIISNTQVMESVMNHMIDRVLTLRLLPQLEGIIRNTVRDVLREEMAKPQNPENE